MDEPKTNWTISAKCEATEENVDPNIFVFHSKPDGDTYSNVASLADMNSLPIGAPTKITNDDDTIDYIPFYRMPEVTLDFCNGILAAHFVDIINIDSKLLVREYKAARKLKEEQIIEI